MSEATTDAVNRDAVNLDPVDLEIRWSRLAAITDEAAATLLRAAFSTIIRESNDYTVVLMNSAGHTVAESRAGIPAFAALIGTLTERLLKTIPAESWHEGDIVITNDPWIATGHLPDIAMVSPIFHRGTLIGFAGSAAHVPDIGGTPTLDATELLAEGLFIPPIHLYRDGVRDEAVVALLRANVRLPVQVWGDLEAQMAAHEVCRRRTIELLEDIGEPDLEELSHLVHAMSDRATRAAMPPFPTAFTAPRSTPTASKASPRTSSAQSRSTASASPSTTPAAHRRSRTRRTARSTTRPLIRSIRSNSCWTAAPAAITAHTGRSRSARPRAASSIPSSPLPCSPVI